MEFEDQEENEAVEMEMGPIYDSVLTNSNSSRVAPKMPSPVDMAAEPTSQRKPDYRECLKNHAVTIGGHAVDGCGEFLPAGAEGTLDAFKCAACNCHRNFHRKEAIPGGIVAPHDPFHFHHHHQHHHYPQPPLLAYRTPSGYLHVSPQPPQQRPLALPSTTCGGREEQENISNLNSSGGGVGGGNGGGMGSSASRKRFRTKFTAEQKDKMLEFAEKLGWKIQKQDEGIIQEFCSEIGIKRHVLKVWMHNNKHCLGVAVGSGWQSRVAYVNIACYYLVGIPLGLVMQLVFRQGVMGVWAGMIFGGTALQTLILGIVTLRCDWNKEAERASKRVNEWALLA